jgi:hypothetical protein
VVRSASPKASALSDRATAGKKPCHLPVAEVAGGDGKPCQPPGSSGQRGGGRQGGADGKINPPPTSQVAPAWVWRLAGVQSGYAPGRAWSIARLPDNPCGGNADIPGFPRESRRLEALTRGDSLSRGAKKKAPVTSW